MLYYVVLLMFAQRVSCEVSTQQLLNNYEIDLNASIVLEKNDRALINQWSQEFQLNQINVTTKYRLQMTIHTEHSLEPVGFNAKWSQCLRLMQEIRFKSQSEYLSSEAQCLISADDAVSEKRNGDLQLTKEIRNWRKGYRYLVRLCRTENPNDHESAGECLGQYMKSDNYDKALNRLLFLKIQSTGELYLQMENSIKNLEDCLQAALLEYLTKVRSIKESLKKCFAIQENK